MLARDAKELFVADPENESIVIDPEERKAILRRLEQADKLEKENRELREKLRRVQEELKRLKASFPLLAANDKTAEAVGVPSSRTFYRRPRPVGELRDTGGQPGHPGTARERPVPNSEPEVYTLSHCPDCGTKLGSRCDVLTRVITDLPPPQPRIFEVLNERYACPGCGERVIAPDPYPPNRHFGLLLMARVVHLRMLGLSIEKVVDYLREGHGVELSTGTVLSIESWVAATLGPLYEKLKEQVREHQVVQADETSFRVRGKNGWMWVFVTLSSVVYRIADSRGQDVVQEVLNGFEGTLVSDAWKPYDSVLTARRQLDLLHVNRWLEKAEVEHRVEPRLLLRDAPAKMMSPGRPPEEFIRFADGVRRSLRSAILWSEAHPEAPGRVRRRVKKSAKRELVRFLKQEWHDADAIRIGKELRRRRRMLFTFVTRPEAPWHNNAAENQIRQGVLFRKISGGRRSWAGARILEQLLTIYRTCRKRRVDFVQVVKDAVRGNGYPAFTASSQPQT